MKYRQTLEKLLLPGIIGTQFAKAVCLGPLIPKEYVVKRRLHI